MGKRVAEEYITKDKGSTPNFKDSGNGVMATPAQIAARNIKAPKSRLGRRGNSAAGGGFSSVSAPNPFGQSQQSTFAPPSSSFTFGAQQSQISFGQDTAQASTPSVFGQSTSQSAPSSFSFGQPSQTNNAPAFSFGSKNTEAAQPASSAPSTFSFTQPSQTNGPAFSFGSNNTQAMQPASSAPSTFSFTQPAQTNGSAFGFGSNGNTASTQSAISTSTFSFGQPAQPSGSTFSFASKNNEPAQPPPAAFSFGQPAQAKETTSTFGANSNTTTTQSAASIFSFAQPAQVNGSTFGFGASHNAESTQPAPPTFPFVQSAPIEDTTMFSPPRKADMPNFFQSQSAAPANAAPVPTKPLFPTPDREPASSPAPSKPLFQLSDPKAAASPAPIKSLFQQPDTEAAASPAPIKSLFQQPNPEAASSPAPIKSLFQQPNPESAATPAPIKSLFQQPNPESAASPAPAPAPATPAPVKSLFQSLPPLERHEPTSTTIPASSMTPAPSKPTFQLPDREPVSSPAPTQAPKQASAPVQFEKVKLRSNGPSEPLITDDHTKWSDHDRKYRLRSLNKELVRRLALYDSGSQDFDNVIMFYYHTREKLGLMWPPGARSTKRKADDEEPSTDRSTPAKKAKASKPSNGNTNSTTDIVSHSSTGTTGASTQASKNNSELSTGDFSSPVKASINETPAPFNSGLSKPYTGPTSNTSNLFQSILSGTATPIQPIKPKSPFANVPTQPQSTAKPVFSFSEPEAVKVTSPTKPVSPPSSDEVAEEDDAEEQESEEDESADGGMEEQDPEEHSGSGDDNGSNEEEDDDEQAPPSKPENLGKSLFDRIQPPLSGGEPSLMTPNGVHDKNTLKQPAPNHSFKPFTPFAAGFAKSTPQAPTVSPITPFGGSVKSKPLSTFDFAPKEPVTTPTPVAGASIFAGGSIKANGPIPGDGLFGSRPSTPSHDEPAPTNIFAGLTKTPHATVDASKDNTWSKGSPLKFNTPQKSTGGGFTFSGPTSTTTNFMTAFGKNAEEHEKADKAKRKYEDLGSDAEQDEIEEWEAEYEEKQRAKRVKSTADSGFGQGGFKPAGTQVDGQAEKPITSAPSFSITAATPPSKDTASSDKFSNLFGQKSATSSPTPPATNPVGFSFGPAATSASALQPASSYLFPSANTSGLSSRASSPGITDNESVGTDGEADTTNDPQTSLMSDRPGEENEEVLYEARTKALKFMDKAAAAKQKGATPDTYNSVGLGILRVLKNAETGKSRIVIRAEPGANVLLNTHLAPFISYTNDSRAEGSGVVRFGVPVDNGKIEQWVLKVKNAGKATDLARILTDNKSPTST